MPFLGDASTPVRFGGGQVGVTNRELFLDVFGGEVFTAFHNELTIGDKVTTKTVGGGQRSWRFPKTWKSQAEYHTPGQEMLGNAFETGEITITVDETLVAHHALSDIDVALSHFDVRNPMANEMGRSLAEVYDANVARSVVLAARTAADGPFPGGTVYTNDALKPVAGVYDGAEWVAAVRQVKKALFEKGVSRNLPVYMAVNWDIFHAMKYATDANGRYLVLNRDVHGTEGAAAGGISGHQEEMVIDGVKIFISDNTNFGNGLAASTGANETADQSVYSKYRADYRATLAIAWTPMAVGSVKVKEMGFEQARDTRRLEDFMVSSMLVGHGTLRPEGAIEIAAATLTP